MGQPDLRGEEMFAVCCDECGASISGDEDRYDSRGLERPLCRASERASQPARLKGIETTAAAELMYDFDHCNDSTAAMAGRPAGRPYRCPFTSEGDRRWP